MEQMSAALSLAPLVGWASCWAAWNRCQLPCRWHPWLGGPHAGLHGTDVSCLVAGTLVWVGLMLGCMEQMSAALSLVHLFGWASCWAAWNRCQLPCRWYTCLGGPHAGLHGTDVSCLVAG